MDVPIQKTFAGLIGILTKLTLDVETLTERVKRLERLERKASRSGQLQEAESIPEEIQCT